MTIFVVDIGGTSLKFGFSVEGKPLDDIRLFPATLLYRSDCIDTLAALTREVVRNVGLVPDVIVSTVPGFIDRDHDRILFAANLPALNDRRLASEWSQAVHIPVLLERDSILLLMGEGVGIGTGGYHSSQRQKIAASPGRMTATPDVTYLMHGRCAFQTSP